ncbi:hypothetical protein WJX72_007256 [[Myrmecia] bisecta]|uniref:Metaxin n=1 Tax=[Myrmecia] bisecta TaxID=41462 RepID=A0AAW1QSI0_9CHLO
MMYACGQVEAYLRLAKIEFALEDCNAASTSPTGALPAVELESGDLMGGTGHSEFDIAAEVVHQLQERLTDLDTRLSAAQRAELLAFTALIQQKLQLATVYTTWCETQSFTQYTRAAYGASLPFPLNYLLTWSQRRTYLQQFKGQSADKVYHDAGEVYSAVAERLQAVQRQGGGSFFFGSHASSLDALLYAHLAYQQGAPVSAPELRTQLARHPILRSYVERLSSEVFASPAPLPPPSTSEEWTARTEAAASGRSSRAAHREKKKRSAEEERMRRNGRIWLGGAAAAIVGYFVLSGQYIDFATEYGFDEDAGDEGDE